MNFLRRRRKAAPTIIIISLIDILIVLLIFLMVTTTFKQQPAVKLALPESKQATSGNVTQSILLITIAPQQPFFYLDQKAVTFDKLQQELLARAKAAPSTQVALNADSNAPWGQIIRVMDAVKAANLKEVSAFTKNAGK